MMGSLRFCHPEALAEGSSPFRTKRDFSLLMFLGMTESEGEE